MLFEIDSWDGILKIGAIVRGSRLEGKIEFCNIVEEKENQN